MRAAQAVARAAQHLQRHLRKAQADFLGATADKWVPPTDPGTQARTDQLTAARADNKAKYVAFQTLVGPAKEMFDELFKVRGGNPNLEPDP